MSRWFRRRRPSTADEQWAALAPTIEEAQRLRRQQLIGREQIVSDLEALLFRHDPIGLNFEDNTDEYRPEAETITLRLPEARTDTDVQRIIHEEFAPWFDADIAGPPDQYAPIASEAWALWTAAER